MTVVGTAGMATAVVGTGLGVGSWLELAVPATLFGAVVAAGIVVRAASMSERRLPTSYSQFAVAAGPWVFEPGLFDYAKSHPNDPETSRQAAESIPLERVSEPQKRVIQVFRFNGRKCRTSTASSCTRGTGRTQPPANRFEAEEVS
jgi:hypothetical protein